MSDKDEDIIAINENELMKDYGFSGMFGKLRLKIKLFNSWFFHLLAYSSPLPTFVVKMQRKRGVKIGKSCYIGPYVQIDLVYPHLISIQDNVTIATNTMIFAHVNPTSNLFFKQKKYPRKTAPVIIKSGAWINPGCIITSGVTIGKNSILSAGSIVTQDVPDNCVATGNPARIIKKID